MVYDAPESDAKQSIANVVTLLATVTLYSVVVRLNAGDSFPGFTDNVSKLQSSILEKTNMRIRPGVEHGYNSPEHSQSALVYRSP